MDYDPLFESLCRSQETYQTLKKAQVRHLMEDDATDWGDTLSDMIYRMYDDADDTDELLTHLRYSISELTKAAEAVRGFRNREEAVR